MIIQGPMGPFKIPESTNPRTAEVCLQLTKQVWGDAETPGEYDHPELPTFKIPPVVFDLGAGWGAFSVWALRKWRGCSLRAYEPHAEAADVWIDNVIGADGLKRRPDFHGSGWAYIDRAAVTTKAEPLLNGCEDWGSYGVMGEGGWPVKAVHPRDLMRCDILKMDIEGAEVEVLENYRCLQWCSALLIEFHDQAKRERVADIATEAGFRCVRTAPVEASYGVSVWVR